MYIVDMIPQSQTELTGPHQLNLDDGDKMKDPMPLHQRTRLVRTQLDDY